MNKISTVLTVVVFFSTIALKAQKSVTFEFENNKQMRITDIVNDPSKFYPLRLSVDLNYMSRPLLRNNLLLRATGEYMVKELGYVQFFTDIPVVGSFDRHYIELSNNEVSKLRTLNALKPYSYTQGGVGINFWENTKPATKTLQLKKTDAEDMPGYDEVHFQGDYDVDLKQMLAGRLGLFHYRTVVSNPYVKDKTIKTEDGKVVADQSDYVDQNATNYIAESKNLYHTNMFVTSLYLGGEYSTKFSVDYTVEETGERRNLAALSRIYGDVLIATSVDFEEMIIKEPNDFGNQSVNVAHKNEGGLKARNLGFRVGYYLQHFSGHSALHFRFETGIRPGLANAENPFGRFMGNSAFFTINLGYTFGTDLGIL